jgi:uncharacterized protein (TIGR02118 family)
MTVVRVCYKSGSRFDHNYYSSTHTPLVMDVMGQYGLTNVEVVTIGPNADGSLPPYQVMFSAYFDSPSALQNAMQSPRMSEVLGDIANYYDGMPDVMIGEVVVLPAAR